MAITDRDTVKSLLNISTGDTSKDAWIDALIPQIEEDYVSIRNKPFDVGTKNNFSAAAALGADREIRITIGNYAIAGESAGTEYDILLRSGDTANIIARRAMNQIEPSGYYNVTAPLANATSSSADIYLRERFEKWTENFSVLDVSVSGLPAGLSATVTKMQTLYPDGAEFTASKMIAYHMNAGIKEGVEAESLGDYSIKYKTESKAEDYPKPIIAGIKRYVRTL